MTKDYTYGKHATLALLENAPERVLDILLVKQKNHCDILNNIISIAGSFDIPIHYCAKSKVDKVVNDGAHQGILAYCSPKKIFNEDDFNQVLNNQDSNLVLILDGVQDVYNLGACLRTANAVGCKLVITTFHGSAGLTPAVKKASSGAYETVNIAVVTNLVRVIEKLKKSGFWVYAADCDSKDSLYDVKFDANTALILGAEGKGMRQLTKKSCDQSFLIPIQNTLQSLNVSVAAGVCLYEILRQHIT